MRDKPTRRGAGALAFYFLALLFNFYSNRPYLISDKRRNRTIWTHSPPRPWKGKQRRGGLGPRDGVMLQEISQSCESLTGKDGEMGSLRPDEERGVRRACDTADVVTGTRVLCKRTRRVAECEHGLARAPHHPFQDPCEQGPQVLPRPPNHQPASPSKVADGPGSGVWGAPARRPGLD